MLHGGTGNETDRVKDFDPTVGFERIALSDVARIKRLNGLMNNHVKQDGGDVVINSGDATIMILVVIEVNDLQSNDFLF